MRVSSDRQAREGDSIPAQRQALLGYVNSHPDLELVGEYLDDGVSGTKSDRSEFLRMLEDVKSGKVSLVLVTKLDRLHRSLKNFLLMQETFDACGADWLAIWEPMYDSSTPQGRMVINTMVNLAQFEAEQTGQRIRQVFAYKVEHGEAIAAHQPLGFSVVDKKLVPNQDAEKVRAIFNHYAVCSNLRETVRFAAEIGVVRSKGNIKNLLSNKKYIGEFRGVSGYCPAIIDRGLFDRVQRNLGMNVRQSQSYDYIFSGLIVCGECGHHFGGSVSYTNGYSRRVYRCNFHRGALRSCPNSRQITEGAMEKHLLSLLPERMEKLQPHAVGAPERSFAEDRRRSIQRKLDRLKELYLAELITLDEFRADRDRLQAELASIPEDAVPDTAAIEALAGFTGEEIYYTFSNVHRRMFWRILVRSITIDADRRIIVDWAH